MMEGGLYRSGNAVRRKLKSRRLGSFRARLCVFGADIDLAVVFFFFFKERTFVNSFLA